MDPSGGEAAGDLALAADADQIASARRAFVSYVRLDNLPFIQPSGDRKWDASTGPDVLIVIRDTQGNVIATTHGPVIEDVNPADLPLSFEVGAQVSDFERVYAVEVYDHDSFTSNELMFKTQTFAAGDAQRAGKLNLDLLSRGGDVIGAVHFRFEGGEAAAATSDEIEW